MSNILKKLATAAVLSLCTAASAFAGSVIRSCLSRRHPGTGLVDPVAILGGRVQFLLRAGG